MKQFVAHRGWMLVLAGGAFLVAFGYVAADIASSLSQNGRTVTGGQLTLLVALVIVTLAVLVVGQAVNGRWSGAFIDGRNRYSLSQAQTICWLVLVTSGVLAAGIANVRGGSLSPLDLAIPPQLLAVVGISLTTMVGSPLIRSTKRDTDPDLAQTNRTLQRLGATADNSSLDGSVIAFNDPGQTLWADLVRGDEAGNADKVDLGKLQLLYFTGIALLVYGAALFNTFGSPIGPSARLVFPPLDDSLVGLLLLSHAGALGYQAAPHATPADQSQAGATLGQGQPLGAGQPPLGQPAFAPPVFAQPAFVQPSAGQAADGQGTGSGAPVGIPVVADPGAPPLSGDPAATPASQ